MHRDTYDSYDTLVVQLLRDRWKARGSGGIEKEKGRGRMSPSPHRWIFSLVPSTAHFLEVDAPVISPPSPISFVK